MTSSQSSNDGGGRIRRPLVSDEHQQIKRTKLDELPFSPASLRPSRRQLLKGTPPTIVEKLKAEEIRAGLDLELKCVVSGDPLPEVSWTRNNIPLQKSDRISFEQDAQGKLLMKIAKTRLEDSGVYMVLAKNQFGIAKISCQILVTAAVGAEIDSRAIMSSRAPLIVKFPESRIVQIGETVTVTIELRSSIETRIIWMFEERALDATTRIKTQFDEETKKASLVILNFQESDFGIYSFRAINADGQSTYRFALQKSGAVVAPMKAPLTEIHNRQIAVQPNVFLERTLKPVKSSFAHIDYFAPILLKPIRNICVRSGLNATFDAVVKGSPCPELNWLFNGKPINFSDHIFGVYSETSYEANLTINGISDSDYGTYSLIAKNSEGEIRCSAKLTEEQILTDSQPFHPNSQTLSSATVPSEPNFLSSGVDSAGFVSMDTIDELEHSRIRPKIQQTTTEDSIEDKPQFLSPLPGEIVLSESETLVLRALVKTPSIPEFIWLKDDGSQASSNRVSSHFDPTTGWITLKIEKLTVPDAGLYALIVKNQAGLCSTNCTVRVTPSPTIESTAYLSSASLAKLESKRPIEDAIVAGVESGTLVGNILAFERLDAPKRAKPDREEIVEETVLTIEQHLSDRSVSEGDQVVLVAKLKAHPEPELKWFRNEFEIQTGSRLIPQYDPFTNQCSLRIEGCLGSDSGKYRLVAVNPSGRVESSCLVEVRDQPSISRTSFKPIELFEELERTKPDSEQTTFVKIDPPVIETIPDDSEWNEGDNLMVSVLVNSQETPKIEWFKNETPILASNRILSRYDLLNKTAIFQIKSLTKTDAGHYTIRATNKSGAVSKTFGFAVRPTESISIKSNVDQTKFVGFDQKQKPELKIEPGVDTTAYVSAERFSELERSKLTKNEFVEDTTNYSAPEFISTFAPEYKCDEGKLIQLICIVSANPLPQFLITKDNHDIESSNRLVADFNWASKLYCFSISSARIQDAGTYRLTAVNPLGKAECSTLVFVEPSSAIDRESMIPYETIKHLEEKTVKVREIEAGVDTSAFVDSAAFQGLETSEIRPRIEAPKMELVAPELYQGLVDSGVDVNGDLCLFAQLFGLPIPEIEWTLDGRPVRASSRIVVHYDILTKTAYLWIKKAGLADSGQYKLVARNQSGLIESSCKVRIYDDGQNIDETAFVSRAKIAEIDSKPEVDRFASLVAGVDETGRVDQSKLQSLDAKSLKSPEFVEQPDSEPKIIRELGDRVVNEGEDLVLEVGVDGMPLRNVQWLFNSLPISPSNNLYSLEDPHRKTISLIVKKVFKDRNEGTYGLIVANNAGKCRSECRVKVNSTPGIDQNSNRSSEKYSRLDREIIRAEIEAGVDSRPQTACPEKYKLLEVSKIGHLQFEENTRDHFAPRFETKLQPANGIEMGTIVLSALCNSNPLPSFMWFKNDQILQESTRFSSHFDIPTKTISLSIVGLTLADSGIYTIVAVNPLGTEKCSAQLVVARDDSKPPERDVAKFAGLERSIEPKQYGKPGIDYSPIVGDQNKLRNLEKSIETKQVTPGIDSSSFVSPDKFSGLEQKQPGLQEFDDSQNYKAPRVLSSFAEKISVRELDNLTIHGTLEAYPAPEMEWTLNGRPITCSNRQILTYDIGTHLLFVQIRGSRPFDAGHHVIRVWNQKGSAEFATDVEVVPISSIDQNPFVPLTAFEHCEKVPEVSEVKAGIDDSSYVSDQQLYRDLDSKSAPQQAQFTPGVDQTSFIDFEAIRDLEKPAIRESAEDEQAPKMAPSFLKQLSAAEVEEHSDLSISASVVGSPVPVFVWKKDGQVLEASSKYIPHYDLLTKTAYLLLRHALESDSGIYSLEAINDSGKADSSSKIKVNRSQSIDQRAFVAAESFSGLTRPIIDKFAELVPGVDSKGSVPIEKYAPLEIKPKRRIEEPIEKKSPLTIKKHLKQIVEVNEFESFTLEAEVDGQPTPQISWKLNGSPILASDNTQTTYNLFTKLARLFVKSANADFNGGDYVLVAECGPNEIAESSARVVVKRQAKVESETTRDITKFRSLDVKLKQSDDVVPGVDSRSFARDLEKLSGLERGEFKPSEVDKDEPNEIPKFAGPLSITKENANEFDTISMSVKVTGRPSPEFYLMKNGNLVVSSNRLAVHYEPRTFVLSIFLRDVVGEDSGFYYVVAHNSQGSVLSSKCQLNVSSTPGIDSSSKLESAKFAGLEREIPLKSFEAGVDRVSRADMQKLQSLESKPAKSYDFTTGVDANSMREPSKFEHLEVQKPKTLISADEDVSKHRAPLLISNLTEITANETQNVLLTAMIDGFPMPEFSWTRNGLKIPFSNRYTSSYDPNSKLLSLVIRHTAKSDEGLYAVEARNSLGKLSCSAKLTINAVQSIDYSAYVDSGETLSKLEKMVEAKEYVAGIETQGLADMSHFTKFDEDKKPKTAYESGIDRSAMVPDSRFVELEKPREKESVFVEDVSNYRIPIIHKPLENLEVFENQNVVLSCVVDGVPIPNFEWFKNGAKLGESNRFRSDYDINSKVCRLYVEKAVLADAGHYMLVMQNSSGKSQTNCEVLVSATDNIDLGSFTKSIDKLKKFDEPLQKVEKDIVVELKPPVFAQKHLEDVSLTEGSCLNLVFHKVTGYPLPSFVFYKNNVQLSEANRIFYRYDVYSKNLYLKIESVNVSDAGIYSAKARNQAGEDFADCKLIVYPSSPIDYSSHIKDPSKTIARLDELGVQTSVWIEPGIDSSSYTQSLDLLKKLDEDLKPAREVEVRTKAKDLAPEFVETLKPISTKELLDLTIKAKLNRAQPICEIVWFKDGLEVLSPCETKYNIQTQEVSLHIPRITRANSGLYKVRARNRLGEVSSEALVSVETVESVDRSTNRDLKKYLGLEQLATKEVGIEAGVVSEPSANWSSIKQLEKSLGETKLKPEAPIVQNPVVVVSGLKDVSCDEGDIVVFVAVITGTPLPSFEWFKNDQLIAPASRFVSHYDLLSGSLFLRISGAREDDIGRYSLRASNCVNRVETAAELKVARTRSILDSPISGDSEKFRKFEKSVIRDLDRTPEIDRSAQVPMERFEKFEMVKKAEWMPVDWVAVDSSSFIAPDRLQELEALNTRIIKQYTGGIDESSMLDDSTLGQLRKMDEFQVSEVFDPLQRDYRLQLVKKMEDQECVEGAPVSLCCQIDAYPIPQFEWTHEGRKIDDSQRLVPHFDPYSGLVALHFMAAYRRDLGLYQLKISNPSGQLVECCELKLDLVAGIDETPYIAHSSYQTLENLHRFRQVADEGFLMFPRIIQVDNLTRLVEFCFRPAHPSQAKIRWVLNGKDVSRLVSMKFELETVFVSFKLDQIMSDSDDQESYRKLVCVVENQQGIFQRLLNISLTFETAGLLPPQFQHELQSCLVNEGDSIVLEALVSGGPELCVEWTKDDFPVSRRYKTSVNQNLCSLTLEKANRADSGWYRCSVQNPGGTATSASKVIVVSAASAASQGPKTNFSATKLKSVRIEEREIESVDPGKVYLSQLKRSRPISANSAPQPIATADLFSESGRRPPSFKIRLPESLKCVESHSCKLQITLVPINDPGMVVEWFKNGALVEASDRISVVFEMGYAVVEIKQTVPDDSGIYECCAKNQFGKDSTKTQLVCEPTKEIVYDSGIGPDGIEKIERLEDQIRMRSLKAPEAQDKLKKGSPPQFQTQLEPKYSSKEGDCLKLTISLSGDPKPRIQWFVAGKSIVSGGRFKTGFDGVICELVIGDLRVCDQGTIRLVAKNKLGQTESSTQLVVVRAKLPAYWDLVIKAAIELDLTAEEVSLIQKDVEQKIADHKKRGIAQEKAEAMIRSFIEGVKSKHSELRRLREVEGKGQPRDLDESPIFVEQLPTSSTFKLNTSQSLKVRFSPPTASVSWYRGNAAIENCRDTPISTNDSGLSVLTVRRVLRSDEGSFKVKVFNAIGYCQCSSEVRIDESVDSNQQIAYLPKDFEVKRGADAIVQCICAERVVWARKDAKMAVGSRVRRLDDPHTNVRSLRILRVDQSDSGEYSCAAGQEKRDFRIKVVDIDDDGIKVIEPLSASVTVAEGSLCELKCSVSGPGIKAEWSKDNVVLSSGRANLEMLDVNSVRILRIANVMASDGGVYECRIGQHGRSSTKLIVGPSESSSIGSLFKSSIRSIAVVEGESLVLKFEAVNTKCGIEWRKDGKVLVSSMNLELVFTAGKGMLFVPKVLAEDAGIYTCQASLGNQQCQCSAQVTVRRL